MVFRICGGIFFLLLAAGYFSVAPVPVVVLGVFALLAGIGLLAGI